MNVFLNGGYSYQGVAKSVTLPKLTRKLENYRGCGDERQRTGRPRPDDDALSMEWSLGGFPDSVIWEFYAATGVGCRTDSFCRLLPARRYRRNGGRRGGRVDVRKKSTPARVNREKTLSRKSRGLHLFPADDGRVELPKSTPST